jgi:hypothetical protein
MKRIRRTGRSLLSFCTGAGGLDIGIERTGFSVSICVELDDDARFTVLPAELIDQDSSNICSRMREKCNVGLFNGPRGCSSRPLKSKVLSPSVTLGLNETSCMLMM